MGKDSGRPMKNLKSLLYFIALFGGFLHVLNAATGLLPPMQMRPIHLAFVLGLAFLVDIIEKKSFGWRFILNLILIALTLLTTGYLVFYYEEIAMNAGLITPEIVIFGSMIILLVLIVTQKALGNVLFFVATFFIGYAFLGSHLPGPLGHRGYSLDQVTNFLYTSGNGIFGVPIDVSARYFVLFMIFSEFIARSGTDRLFVAVAKFVAEKTRGGAAKASVVSSACFGTISGSPIANVMVTGSFTIPMMKKSGFPNYLAAAVEATASTGGLIMPPIMGAGAFIMAEILGVSYSNIMIAAVVPAILYYFSLYLAIDMYAKMHPEIRIEKMPAAKDKPEHVLYYLHTIIPLILFIAIIVMGYSVFRGAIIALAVTPVISMIRPYTRMSFRDILDGISQGMIKCIKLGAACAAAGIIVGVIALTGFGFSFAELLSLFSGMPSIALMITAALCILLGMGMPAVASYLIVATLAVPVLIKFGFIPLAAHLFIFYFACFSSVTPPVALATYAASGLAESDPWRTGWQGFILASVAFLAPFIFIYSPALLLKGNYMDILIAIPTALVGVIFYVCAIQGYFFGKVKNVFLRMILGVAGCFLIIPGIKTDLIALGLAGVVFFIQRLKRQEAKEGTFIGD
jgi:TRAP transporter 4TM/12TM fusion protein